MYLLPIIFTLSPVIGWWMDAPLLTLLFAAVLIPLAEWIWRNYTLSTPTFLGDRASAAQKDYDPTSASGI